MAKYYLLPAILTISLTSNLLAQDTLEVPPAIDPGVMVEEDATTTDEEVFELTEPAPIMPPDNAFISSDDDDLDVGGDAEVMETIPDTSTAFDSIPETTAAVNNNRARDFNQEDLPTVLRLLARQAGINLVVSDLVLGTVTMRLEDVSAMQAINVVVQSKGLFMDESEGIYYIKTPEEKAAEPTESGNFTFSYARAEDIKPLLQKQLNSGIEPDFDPRTNTIFYREARSNMENIAMFLETVDRPTKQVMIEARLVEVTANPRQSYGINWNGALGGQTISLGGSVLNLTEGSTSSSNTTVTNTGTAAFPDITTPDGVLITENGTSLRTTSNGTTSTISNAVASAGNFLLDPNNLFSTVGGQFAILSAPELSASLSLINQDDDAEFLANPRIVTADNQEATIEITRNQPVPQLNFNEQTATAVFGGFEDEIFGNILTVTPSVNKDDFITLSVKPEVSNKVADAVFTFAGAEVASPIIDTRKLESNVLIKSGHTLAIGGLLQDETLKQTTKVPILGDIPILGYLFQEKVNSRVKRNLLVFVTPTILDPGFGTGLEDQVNGLTYSGEEFADPTGWRNNAKGAVRLVPTSHRSIAADYPVPGTPIQPQTFDYKTSASSRE